MKETIRKNIVDLPYSLHDARVNKIQIEEQNIVLHFSGGYYKPMDNYYLPVKENAVININGVDLDFCHAYLITAMDICGKFTGEKYGLQEFVSNFPDINFEIVDETYGYNQSKFSGNLYNNKEIKECIIEIYHFGDMKYIVDD